MESSSSMGFTEATSGHYHSANSWRSQQFKDQSFFRRGWIKQHLSRGLDLEIAGEICVLILVASIACSASSS